MFRYIGDRTDTNVPIHRRQDGHQWLRYVGDRTDTNVPVHLRQDGQDDVQRRPRNCTNRWNTNIALREFNVSGLDQICQQNDEMVIMYSRLRLIPLHFCGENVCERIYLFICLSIYFCCVFCCSNGALGTMICTLRWFPPKQNSCEPAEFYPASTYPGVLAF